MDYVEERKLRPASGFVGLAIFIAVILAAVLAIVVVSIMLDRGLVGYTAFCVTLAVSIVLICLD